MTDLSAIIAFIPEPQRGYVLAALYAFLATQFVASGIVAVLPAEAFKWRPLRALSWYAHLAPRDAAGTFKAPFTAPLNPGAMADLAKLQAFAARVQRVAPELAAEITPPTPSKVTPVDHSGERGLGHDAVGDGARRGHGPPQRVEDHARGGGPARGRDRDAAVHRGRRRAPGERGARHRGDEDGDAEREHRPDAHGAALTRVVHGRDLRRRGRGDLRGEFGRHALRNEIHSWITAGVDRLVTLLAEIAKRA